GPGLGDVLQAVADPDLDPRVVERAVVDVLQIAARNIDHLLVELDNHDPLHARVLQEFLGRATVPATDDQRATRPRMGNARHVNEVLVVVELVALRAHEAAIEPEQTTEARRLPDLIRLPWRAPGLE